MVSGINCKYRGLKERPRTKNNGNKIQYDSDELLILVCYKSIITLMPKQHTKFESTEDMVSLNSTN